MIYDKNLTAEQRRRSQKNYNCYNLINGMSYMCLGETIIILLAVKLNTPDIIVTIIGSMIFLGFLLLPLGVWRAACVGAARTQAEFWVARNLAALLVAGSALFMPVSRYVAWGIMLLGSFLFYGFRAAGIVMFLPLIGDIASPEERPGLIAQSWAFFYMSGFAALLIISLMLGIYDSVWCIAAIILAGAALGITASVFIRKIDETATIMKTAGKPLWPQLKLSLRSPVLRRQIYAGFMVNLSIIMLIPVSILTIKRGYGISDRNAVFFSAAQLMASIAGAKLGGYFTEKFSSAKVALFSYILMFPSYLFWIFAPPPGISLIPWILVVPFVLTGITAVAAQNAMMAYFLGTIPARQQITGAMLVNLVTGTVSGIAGMLITGSMIHFSAYFFEGTLAVYKGYFAMSMTIFLAGIFLLKRITK